MPDDNGRGRHCGAGHVKADLACALGGALLAMAMGSAAAGEPVAEENAVVTPAATGDALHVSGVIGSQFEPDVREALHRHPSIRRIVVASPGGLRAQALRVGSLVNRHGLTVRVEGRCASACVLLWATAASREMTVDSRIGLHRSSLDPDLPIPDTVRRQLIERNDRETDEVLRRAGFSQRVVAMGAATPPTTMAWFTPGELKVEGVPFALVDDGDRGGGGFPRSGGGQVTLVPRAEPR